MTPRSFLDATLSILRVHPRVGGLEISDSTLRFVSWDGAAWQTITVRMPVGTLRAGEIQNRDFFLRALVTLRSQIVQSDLSHSRVNVVAVLSSRSIFLKRVLLPPHEVRDRVHVIDLNLRSISPIPFEEAYAGWQIIADGASNRRPEILAGILEKSIVQSLNAALYEAGFTVIAIESRALALIRYVRSLPDMDGSFVVVHLDQHALDIALVRNGAVELDYLEPWSAEDYDFISSESMQAAFVGQVRQVMTYASSRGIMVDRIFVVAPDVYDTALALIQSVIPSISVSALPGGDFGVGEDWYVALGAGLRGLIPRRLDHEISVLGVDANEQFRREQMVRFLSLWRVLVPAALGILGAVFIIFWFILGAMLRTLTAETLFQLPVSQKVTIETLERDAQIFNGDVAMLRTAESARYLSGPILHRILALAEQSGIVLDRISFDSPNTPIRVTGRSKNQESIGGFRAGLENDPLLRDIRLSLSDIVSGPQGFSFIINFSRNSANTR